ncbi:MAG TPA: hypothetical protein VIF35_00300 [Streptosporangiaceae bacterium]
MPCALLIVPAAPARCYAGPSSWLPGAAVRAAARRQIEGPAGLIYRAAGLTYRAAGLAISPAGLITGAGRAVGTSTVTVTGMPASGASAAITFACTISPPPGS